MAERYDIIQHIQTAAGALRWLVCSRDNLRAAQIEYDTARGNHPTSYFELLRVVHTETCVAHTGTPMTPIKPGEDEGDKCGARGCDGTLRIVRKRCYCAAVSRPPCSACTSAQIICDTCDREIV